ncbi:hypothetical protein B4064_3519 [Caldibacillus thermoamylovorans]|nr:hypothetical protein B4064_3519 [Caldibacillus thermoamylovorans]
MASESSFNRLKDFSKKYVNRLKEIQKNLLNLRIPPFVIVKRFHIYYKQNVFSVNRLKEIFINMLIGCSVYHIFLVQSFTAIL